MSSKKNIDRLFQERFKDFEAAPPMAAWDHIEKQLDGKKPVAGTPLWIKWISIAAGIALLTTIGYTTIFNDSMDAQQIVIDDNNTDTFNDATNDSSSQQSLPSNDLLDYQNQERLTSSDDVNASDNDITTNGSGNLINNVNENVNQLAGVNNNATSSNSQKDSRASKHAQKPSSITNTTNNNNNTAYYTNSKDKSKGQTVNQKGNQQSPFKINNNTFNAIPNNNNETLAQNKKTQLPVLTGNKSDKSQPQFNTPSTNDTGIAAQETPQDSTKLQPSLEDMAAQQQQDEDEKAVPLPFKKWNASSVIAPVYSSTIGGSSIDQQFADNNKAAGVNLSYGVNVGYNLSSRFTVRTGVHRVNMSYTTNDIVYGIEAQPDVQLLSVNSYDRNAVSNPGNISTDNLGSSFSQEFLSDNTFNGFQGEISQRLGYLEVPLELKYKVLDSKLSVNVMGGLSALFLTDNSIAVTNNTAKLELGEDDNFNSFNQSANFGVGIDYLFTDQLGLTIEPMFKYQLNALRENTAGFRPFNIGVYSGITYRF